MTLEYLEVSLVFLGQFSCHPYRMEQTITPSTLERNDIYEGVELVCKNICAYNAFFLSQTLVESRPGRVHLYKCMWVGEKPFNIMLSLGNYLNASGMLKSSQPESFSPKLYSDISSLKLLNFTFICLFVFYGISTFF